MIWIVLAMALLLIAWYLSDDYCEADVIEKAEWIIADYCAEVKDCKTCSKYVEEFGYCKYRMYAPTRWKEEDKK